MKSYSPFQLAFILKHALSNEIWIINTQGEIQCLKTPFKVIVIKEIGLLTIDSIVQVTEVKVTQELICLLYTSPSPRDQRGSRMPSSA